MTNTTRILVTGSGGFIGRALVERLSGDQGVSVVAVTRRQDPAPKKNVDHAHVGEMNLACDWRAPLHRVDTVVHLAARVHVMAERAVDPLTEYRKSNVAATLNLARQAVECGAKRFVFMSSIKVNGEFTRAAEPFRADDEPAPIDPYGVSKLEAEIGLKKIAKETGLQVVVIRPPLVYGPGVRANFRGLMGWLLRGLPLPFGAVNNRRSLIGLDNLCDLIAVCSQHPAAAGKTFLASDGEDVSITELLQRLGSALGTPARLLPVPHKMLRTVLTALGQRNIAQRLCCSLQVDIAPTCTVLNWAPPIALDEGLRRTAQAFLAEAR